MDEFEEGGETSTRPRLTKDQVDVLESQFQAQPKPNSNVKRHLAGQTKLTLPRVAVSFRLLPLPSKTDLLQNWFQNRRAKAKQQKKQEEFEIKRALGMADGWKSDGSLPSGYSIPLHLNTTDAIAHSDGSRIQMTPSSASAVSGRNSAQDASWASLQRAISAATAAQDQRALEQEREQSFTAMPPPPMPPSEHGVLIQSTSYPSCTPRATSSHWPQTQSEESLSFDFGFAQPEHSYSSDASQSQGSPEATSVPGFAVPADVWSNSLHTPTAPSHPIMHPVDHGPTTFSPTQPVDINQRSTFSPPMVDTTFQLPQYPASRRGSGSDELTSNFGNFAVSTPPIMPSPLRTTSDLESFKRNEGEIDLAARRKRPRPAALGSAALRSRSYGAPPSMSPTLRNGNHSPHPYPVRHVKSMGQNLNIRYGGVRKPSSAQRSPLNIATFAEADAFGELIQSQQNNAESHTGTTPPTPISSDDFLAHQFPIHEDGLYLDQDQHTPHQFYFNGQPLNFNMASPPSTPLKPEFYPAHIQTSIPPLSAPPQYAVFTDHTPPYSAGPTTSSSWQEASFTSAEMYQIPQVMYPTARDFSNGAFPNFSVPPQSKVEATYASTAEETQTEFFIQEFPRQKEEHAHAAQQLPQQKPKNYVFANATPNDF